jgi:hypothetical protein
MWIIIEAAKFEMSKHSGPLEELKCGFRSFVVVRYAEGRKRCAASFLYSSFISSSRSFHPLRAYSNRSTVHNLHTSGSSSTDPCFHSDMPCNSSAFNRGQASHSNMEGKYKPQPSLSMRTCSKSLKLLVIRLIRFHVRSLRLPSSNPPCMERRLVFVSQSAKFSATR